MKNLAPDIFRQRLLIEGFFSIEITREVLANYLKEIAEQLEVSPYGEAVIFSPGNGMGKEENQGFDAFLPLIDSGISAYIWSRHKFFSIFLYTCKGFNEEVAISYTKDFFKVEGEVTSQSI